MKMFVFLIVAMLASVPVSAGASDKGAFDEKNESIFLFRIEPSLHRVIVFNGKMTASEFRFSMFTPARFTGLPEDGYVLVRGKANEWLGVSNIGGLYVCGGGTSVAFTAPVGRISYVGDLTYTPTDKSFSVRRTERFEDAKAYLARTRPEWVDRLESVEPKEFTIKKKCSKSAGVIYIPL